MTVFELQLNRLGKYLIVASLWAILGWTGNIKGSDEAWIIFFESLRPADVLYWCTHVGAPDWCDTYYYYYQVYQHQIPRIVNK